MKTFGLTAHEQELIRGVLREHPEITGAKVFGSRAKGASQPNSDIDLALEGKVSKRLSAEISEELDDLPLPYLFDVTAYDNIEQRTLKEHIDRVGQVFYERNVHAHIG